MQHTDKKLQILAPAGSCDQLVAAVNNGCDAVYLGLDSFNARMKAPNFTLDNLSEWIDYCHLFGVKVYVAINTSIKNDEFLKAVELLKNVYMKNADGVIVTDLALIRIASEFPKPFEIVASTQLNIHDKYGAEFVKRCGATTVVCARECSLAQIREIASTGIEVECFLHGAMCVCQSGQCLFSSIVGGNSGNRGLCAQPCRKYYTVEDNSNRGGYLLSARDMCSLDTAIDLAKSGATTFKIEGRNRRPEYAGLASRVYRKLFDNNFSASNDDCDLLAEMYNRGMSSNNYLSGTNSDIIYPATQNHIGVEIGTVKHGSVLAFKQLRKGDGLKVFDNGKEICGGIVLQDGIGLVRAQFSGKVADGMQVRRTTSIELCNDVLSVKKKLNVEMLFVARIGQRPYLQAKCNGVEVCVEADFETQAARTAAVSSYGIEQQLRKSGQSQYTICDIVTSIDNIFIAKSQINALRRNILEKLTKELINSYNDKLTNRSNVHWADNIISESSDVVRTNVTEAICAVICYDEKQLNTAKEYSQLLIYKPSVIDSASVEVAVQCGAYIDLPSFADLQYLEKTLSHTGVRLLCNNVGHIQFARDNHLEYIVGRGLNIFNDYIANEFFDAKTFVYSYELTLNEIAAFKNKDGLTFVDGLIPLMQLSHCPYKVALGCDCSDCKSSRLLAYCDELGNRFEMRRRQAGRCVFELINGNKLSVVSKLKKQGRYLLDYDEEVLKHYLNLNKGTVDAYTELSPYTKGRLYDKTN